MNTYLKIVITLVFAASLTLLYAYFLKKGYQKHDLHKIEAVNEIYDGITPYDIIFIGSSRTHTTVYPKIVDSITSLNTYNAGIEGGNIYEFKLTLDGYLANHPSPKMLVLTVDALSLDISKKIFFTPRYFTQLDEPEIRSAFKEMKEYNPFSLYSFLNVIYYDDYIKGLAIKGWTGQTELTDAGSFEYKGFLSNGTKCLTVGTDSLYIFRPAILNREGITCFESIITTCRKKGINLIFTYAPEYKFNLQKYCTNFPEFINVMKKTAARYSIPFYRDDSLQMCQQPCYFANYGHVNTAGAIEYSTILGQRLKNKIDKL